MAMIVPAKGESKQTAKLLLELADDVHDVHTTMEGPDGMSFVVSDELHDRFVAATTEPVPPHDPPAASGADDGAPAPKRRGRPPGSKNKPKDVGTEE